MRKAKWMTSVLGAALLAAATAGAAHAQATCTEVEFLPSKYGQKYFDAENELFQNENPAAAVQILNQLKNNPELNCYAKGAVLRLSAGAKMQMDNPAGAVQDMEQAIRVGAVQQKDLLGTYYNIAQLSLSADNVPKAKEYMEKWIRAGATPNRDQNFQMAVIYQKLDDYRSALPYAEKVLAAEGSNAKEQTIDFLIFLYDRTGNRAKKAELLERKLVMNPGNKQVWDAIAGEYFQAGEERKAFEVQKAMYLAGLLKTEDELMRIVNFYNRFNAPYEAAKILEKEINANRISDSLERLELLANLYQVAREYDKAIPIIQRAAQKATNGRMDERLGRSYFELGEYRKAISALETALKRGNLKEPGYANILIGQSHYELDERQEAREAFLAAQKFSDGRRAGSGWIQFMNAEVETKKQFALFEQSVKVEGLQNEQKSCNRLKVLGENLPESCQDIDQRVEEAVAKFKELQGGDES